MILILSNKFDQTTSDVEYWLRKFNANYQIVYPEDVLLSLKNVHLNADSWPFNDGISDRRIDFSKVKVVWHRKWHVGSLTSKIFKEDFSESNSSLNELSKFINRQIGCINQFFIYKLKKSYWINDYENSNINKFIQLEYAIKHELDIPFTLISTSFDFIELNSNTQDWITKVMDNLGLSISSEENIYEALTCEFNNTHDTFLPSLFQHKIKKSYELRVFYLDKQCYSMAIFSQSNSKTEVDFRNYDLEKPNRTIKYRLPQNLEYKIINLMKDLKLETGSLDFIKGEDGIYYFLEVNPLGQFKMVSAPCNYNLEYLVANFLIKKANSL